jgi:hypothetical protein
MEIKLTKISLPSLEEKLGIPRGSLFDVLEGLTAKQSGAALKAALDGDLGPLEAYVLASQPFDGTMIDEPSPFASDDELARFEAWKAARD